MRKTYTIILTIIMLSAAIMPLHASFETWGISVRAKGMGDAMAAMDGDISSLVHNPAGLATIKSVQLTLNYNLPMTGLDETGLDIFNASFVAPFVNNNLINWPGAFFNLISFGLTKKFFQDGAYGISFYSLDDEMYYEQAFTFALSRKFFNILGSGLNFSVGTRFNVFMRGINPNEYTVINPYFDNGVSSAGFGLDAGAIMFLSDKFQIGIYMNNIIAPEMAINSDLASELLNTTLSYGVSWQVGNLAFMQNLVVAYSYSSLGKDEDDIREAKTINHVGFEFWQFNHQLSARFGYEWGDDLSNLSAGFSYNLAFGSHDLQLDYAFIFPTTMRSTSGSHLLSLTYRMSLSKKYFEFDDKKQDEMKRLDDLSKKAAAQKTDSAKDKKVDEKDKTADDKDKKKDPKTK